MEQIFVYGTLQSGQRKSWMIPVMPWSKLRKYRLYGYKMYMRENSTAGVVKGKKRDYIDGQIKTLIWPWLQKIILDLNEGTATGIYKRKRIKTKMGDVWIYLYNRPIKSLKVIKEWKEKRK